MFLIMIFVVELLYVFSACTISNTFCLDHFFAWTEL